MALKEYFGDFSPIDDKETRAISAVFDVEGGYNPKDPVTGKPVKYGIDQKANPEVDVKNLSKNEAAEIYKRKYWQKSGAANLPDDLAVVHFDAAVHSGVDKAKDLLRQSGGDVNKYIELRKQSLASLGEQEKYASVAKGWTNRMAKVEQEVKGTTAATALTPYTGDFTPLGLDKDEEVVATAEPEVKGKLVPYTEEGVTPVKEAEKIKVYQNIDDPVIAKLNTMKTGENRITYEKVTTNPALLKIISNYATDKYGEQGAQQKGESNSDYVARFMRTMRLINMNEMYAVPELNYLRNADQDKVLRAARAHHLYEAIPDFYEAGGQASPSGEKRGVLQGLGDTAASIAKFVSTPPSLEGLKERVVNPAGDYSAPIRDLGMALVSPTNLLTTGLAAGAKMAISRGTIQATIGSALSARTAAITTGAVVDGVLGVGVNAVDQKIQRITGEQEDEFNYGIMAFAGLLSALGGAGEMAGTIPKNFKDIPSTKAQLEARLAGKRTPVDPTDSPLAKLKKQFADEADDIGTNVDFWEGVKTEGRATLNKLSPEEELTNAKIKKTVSDKAIEAAMYVMYLDPKYSRQQGQKMSEAINLVLRDMDKIDGDVIDAALKQADISPTDFANAIHTTVSDAGKTLNSISQVSKTLNKLKEIDPAAKKQIDLLFGDNEPKTVWNNAFFNAVRTVERNAKALMVSGISTTVNNVLGTSTALTFKTASDLIDGTFTTFGKALYGAATGNYQKGMVKQGLKDTLEGAFDVWGKLKDVGLTAETVDALLINNPNLKTKMFSALQDSNSSDLIAVARYANTLNMAQDVFYRRAIFAAAVQSKLKKVGIDMYDVLANNKQIPVEILKSASDDALKATFSYMPKTGVVNKVVSAIEQTPFMSLAIPFPRFMANAIAFQNKYTFGGATGAIDLVSGYTKLRSKDAGTREAGKVLMEKGMSKVANATVGAGVIALAIDYRSKNQDTEWYEVKNVNGSTTDVRGTFPLGPIFAIGDYIAKSNDNEPTRLLSLIEQIAGMKAPAGTTGAILNDLPKAIVDIASGETSMSVEKFAKAFGQVTGDFLGRATTPAKFVTDYVDLFREEGTVARDPNAIDTLDTKGFFGIAGQTAYNRVINKLPVLKEDLPEYQPYFSLQAPTRDGVFFNAMVGAKSTPQRKQIETEFIKLGLPVYKFYPSTGDKIFDRNLIAAAITPYDPKDPKSLTPMDVRIGSVINSEEYKGYTQTQKRNALGEAMKELIQEAKETVEGNMFASDKETLRYYKIQFSKLPPNLKRGVNELYKEQSGKTMEEAEDYTQLPEYLGLMKQYR